MQQQEYLRSICSLCKHEFTSDNHNNKCTTVNMNTIKNVYFYEDGDSIPKSLMTYGLCGCSAILIVKYEKGKDSPISIHFSHLVYTRDIVRFLDTNLTDIDKYDYYVIIKTPGEFELIDGKYEFNSKDKIMWNNLIIDRDEYKNVNYEFINYSTMMSSSENASYRKLYCDIRYDKETKKYCIYYTNNYGIFKPVLSITE